MGTQTVHSMSNFSEFSTKHVHPYRIQTGLTFLVDTPVTVAPLACFTIYSRAMTG